ncbi:MAG: hypothetical protein IJV00_02700 [Clostridia bacterium]|nr:hypothetical protein [Clostridia bacterium]
MENDKYADVRFLSRRLDDIERLQLALKAARETDFRNMLDPENNPAHEEFLDGFRDDDVIPPDRFKIVAIPVLTNSLGYEMARKDIVSPWDSLGTVSPETLTEIEALVDRERVKCVQLLQIETSRIWQNSGSDEAQSGGDEAGDDQDNESAGRWVEWFRPKDKLPEDGEEVLFVTDGYEVKRATFEANPSWLRAPAFVVEEGGRLDAYVSSAVRCWQRWNVPGEESEAEG